MPNVNLHLKSTEHEDTESKTYLIKRSELETYDLLLSGFLSNKISQRGDRHVEGVSSDSWQPHAFTGSPVEFSSGFASRLGDSIY